MKKIFRNIVVSFISICSFFNVANGDVYLTYREVNNAEEFVEFIKKCLSNELTAARFPVNINWQMSGCAVFLPEGDATPQKVYVAKKRMYNGGDVADNNTNTGGHVLNYTSNMHTERQLAIVALEEALGNTLSDSNDTSDNLVKGAKTPLSSDNLLKSEDCANLKGTLCIYTESPPCRNNDDDNCNYPCIAYYQQLSTAFPNVKFRIFFYNFTNITAKTGAIDYINLPFLFNELANLVRRNKITLQIKCCLSNTSNQKILEVPLRSMPSEELMDGQWNATGNTQNAFTAVAKIMNQYLQHEEQQQEKNNLFNRLYNTNRPIAKLIFGCESHCKNKLPGLNCFY